MCKVFSYQDITMSKDYPKILSSMQFGNTENIIFIMIYVIFYWVYFIHTHFIHINNFIQSDSFHFLNSSYAGNNMWHNISHMICHSWYYKIFWMCWISTNGTTLILKTGILGPLKIILPWWFTFNGNLVFLPSWLKFCCAPIIILIMFCFHPNYVFIATIMLYAKCCNTTYGQTSL